MLFNIFRRVAYSTKSDLKKPSALLINYNSHLISLSTSLHICLYIITVKIPISIFLLTKTTLSVKHLFHLLVQLCYNRYLILTRGDVII